MPLQGPLRVLGVREEGQKYGPREGHRKEGETVSMLDGNQTGFGDSCSHVLKELTEMQTPTYTHTHYVAVQMKSAHTHTHNTSTYMHRQDYCEALPVNRQNYTVAL